MTRESFPVSLFVDTFQSVCAANVAIRGDSCSRRMTTVLWLTVQVLGENVRALLCGSAHRERRAAPNEPSDASSSRGPPGSPSRSGCRPCPYPSCRTLCANRPHDRSTGDVAVRQSPIQTVSLTYRHRGRATVTMCVAIPGSVSRYGNKPHGLAVALSRTNRLRA